MPTPLFQALLRADQVDLPTIEANIDTALAVHNMKERLKEVHRVVAILVRYTILQNAEKEGIDLSNLGPIVAPPTNAAQVPVQHFPSAGNITLGPPPVVISPRVINTIVGSEALPGSPVMNTGLDAPEPEASDVIEVVIGRGGTKVIPPRGSGLAPQTFAAGQIVDAAKIVGSGPGNPSQG
jgi:hypothetical protein